MYINKFFNKKILEIKELSGGVTNRIYKIKCMNNKEYIYREYGKNSKNIINRENDINFLSYVNKFDIGPKIINSFDNGRIESFEKGNIIKDFVLIIFLVLYILISILLQLHHTKICLKLDSYLFSHMLID